MKFGFSANPALSTDELPQKGLRLRWVDQWRGLAVFLMAAYHIGFDLNYMNIVPVNQQHPLWIFEGHFVRLTFLLLVGVSLYISRRKRPAFSDFFGHHTFRAIALFAIAMGFTIASWLIDPSQTIVFGILHLISVGIVLGSLATASAPFALLLGLFSLFTGAAIAGATSENWLLLPLGLPYPGFTSFDYFPVFPWIGFIFFGIGLGGFLDKFGLLNNPKNWPSLPFLEWAGRHALLIYIVHQPILIGAMWFFSPKS